MMGRFWLSLAAAVLANLPLASDARAQDVTALTAAGRYFHENVHGVQKTADPLPSCMFPGGLCGATRPDGSIAVPPKYDWVGRFVDGFAIVRRGLYLGVVNTDGALVVPAEYTRINESYHPAVGPLPGTFKPFKSGLAAVELDGNWGVVDSSGAVVFRPQFKYLEIIDADHIRISENNPTQYVINDELFLAMGSEWRVIDRSGATIERSPPKTNQPCQSAQDVTGPRWTGQPGAYRLESTDGSPIVDTVFERCGGFVGDRAIVTFGGKVGIIDRRGAFVVQPTFDAIEGRFTQGRSMARVGDKWGMIDMGGAWVLTPQFARYSSVGFSETSSGPNKTQWYLLANNGQKWGAFDHDGKQIMPFEFDKIQVQRSHWLVGTRDGLRHYYYSDSRFIGRLPDDPSTEFHRGPPFVLSLNGGYGLIGGDGHPLSDARYQQVKWADNKSMNVRLDGKWGRIDTQGSWLIQPIYDYLDGGYPAVAAVNGKRGILRQDGTWQIEPSFDAARLEGKDTAVVTVDGATGLLRVSDRSWIIRPRPGVLCPIKGGFVWQHNSKRVVLSPTGETWIDIDAERIGLNLEMGLLPFLRGGKWGLADTAGAVVVEPRYDEPFYFISGSRAGGIAWPKESGRWCPIDRRGNAVPGMPCKDENPKTTGTVFKCTVEQ